jgi:RimJ/RimL family protein N-acetyltransferase
MRSDICPLLTADAGIALEPLLALHADALFDLLADARLGQFTDDEPPVDRAALFDRYRRLETRRSPDESALWLNWAVRVPEGGIVGYVQATVAADRSTSEIAYVIGRPFWRRGFATAAVRRMIAFLRDGLGVRDIRATVDERNTASLRLLRTLGLRIADDRDRRNLRFAFTAPSRLPP